jgi:ADP-heptose:LPS heptosyltransferase
MGQVAVSRLLLLENHHAGDAVLALPFLRGASRRFSEISVCCTAAGAEIL